MRWRDGLISIWRRFAIKVSGGQDPGKRYPKYKTTIQMLYLATIYRDVLICMLFSSENIKINVTSNISNYPSHREVSCPFDILIVNVGNNDDHKRQQMNRNLVDETKR